MGWYAERFEPHSGRVQVSCRQCGRALWFPPSEVARRKTCGEGCRLAAGAEAREARRMSCAHCAAEFTPRTTQLAAGQGRFCSTSCSTKHLGQLWTPQARLKAAEAFLANIKTGKFRPPAGPAHRQWAGGPKATQERRAKSGKAREQTRRYRKENPHKVREFAARRSARKCGRLPAGTVQRLGQLQRWRCAICRAGIRKQYHLDHITALANGGAHAPWNLQLLCPSCNVRKSAKDPIQYMQERGFLL